MFHLQGFVSLIFASVLCSAAATAGERVDEDHQNIAAHPLTIKEAIETSRVISGVSDTCVGSGVDGTGAAAGAPAPRSPDGLRYAAMLVRGDIARNGVWITIVAGDLRSIDHVRARKITERFSRAIPRNDNGGGVERVLPSQNGLVWIDNFRVAFLAQDDNDIEQVASVDTLSGELTYLTRESTDVTSFCVGGAGYMIYSTLEGAAQSRHALSQKMLQEGFAVQNSDLRSLLIGDVDGEQEPVPVTQRFVLATRSGERVRLPIRTSDGTPIRNRLGWDLPFPVFSHTGRYAIVNGSPERAPEFAPEWQKYADDYTGVRIRAAAQGDSVFSFQVTQLYVVDLKTGLAWPIWDAPSVTLHGPTRVFWSSEDDRVFLAPTFLPAKGDDPRGLAGEAAAVVNVKTGAYESFRHSVSGRDILKASWVNEWQILATFTNGTSQVLHLRRDRRRTTSDHRGLALTGPAKIEGRVNVELRQSADEPPAFYARNLSTGEEQLVFDPNPQLRQAILGRVEDLTWRDKASREWHGMFYHAARAANGARAPLVIQTHGIGDVREFTLYGGPPPFPGLGPGQIGYIAQVLAGRGIAVLQVEDKWVEGISNTYLEPRLYADAYEAAIRELQQRGDVDATKVGLMGFSRTGWHVEWALTHTDFAYAAALVIDNIDGSYSQAANSGWSLPMVQRGGAVPFGDGLRVWLREAPSFNAEKIHVPLQMQAASGGLSSLIGYWEMFSRLRYLKKPVELYVLPDIEHGAHNPQSPIQVLASQQRAVDWWEFWLCDREDPAQSKQPQYAAWRKLRTLASAKAAGS